MPSHQIRVQQNNCDHKFIDSRICLKCGIHIDKLMKLGPEWDKLTASISHLKQNIKDLLK